MGVSCDVFDEAEADCFELPSDDVPDRLALEVDDVADSFRKAPKIVCIGSVRTDLVGL